MTRRGKIHIGTSGWHYESWKGPFYPDGLANDELLPWYAAHFHTTEINNTFYRLPSEKTLAHWRVAVPEGFFFAVKASRFITHMKKLKDPESSLGLFLERIGVLKETLGPILFQLPPRWRCNPKRLRSFLEKLPPTHRHAFEFRDESWFSAEILALLTEFRAAFCIYDLDRRLSPKEITSDFVYVRLHGPNGPYRGEYDPGTLAGWADDFSSWAGEGKEIYCYFDNDEAGYAAADARRLQEMVGGG
jgi:uncharacterized protein YecE (DUF72 family)